MTILTTARLRFEPFDERHVDGLQAMNRDPAVQRYLLGRPETPDETRAAVERVQARWAAWGYGWWAFLERDSGEVVGAGCIQHLGQAKLVAMLLGIRRKWPPPADATARLARVNGQPGLVLAANGLVFQTMSLEIENGRISAVYTVRNPEKLSGLDA